MQCIELWHWSCTLTKKSIWQNGISFRKCSLILYHITQSLSEYDFLLQGSHHPIFFSYADHKPILFLFTQKSKPKHKLQLILMKFRNLNIVWNEGKIFSLPDFLSSSLMTTTQDEHRLRTVKIPDSIKIFMKHNQQTQPIQCQYAVSKE